MQASQLGLTGQQLAGQLQSEMGQGLGSLASMYGQQGLASQQLAQGYNQLGLSSQQGLSNVYNQAAQGLANIYGQAGQLGQGYENLALAGQTGQTNAYQNAAAGLGNLYNINAQLGQGYGQMQGSMLGQGANAVGAAGQGYQSLAGLYGNLLGQGYGYGAQMTQPYYYNPQYVKNPGVLDWITGLGQLGMGAASVAMLL
jgi:hypothetical protein